MRIKSQLAMRRKKVGTQSAYLLVMQVVLATAATIIASQALISGAFSITQQASVRL